MLQKLKVNFFEWIKDTFEINKDFIKNYNQESDDRYIFEVDVQYPEKLHDLHMIYLFSERIKIEKSRKACS